MQRNKQKTVKNLQCNCVCRVVPLAIILILAQVIPTSSFANEFKSTLVLLFTLFPVIFSLLSLYHLYLDHNFDFLKEFLKLSAMLDHIVPINVEFLQQRADWLAKFQRLYDQSVLWMHLQFVLMLCHCLQQKNFFVLCDYDHQFHIVKIQLQYPKITNIFCKSKPFANLYHPLSFHCNFTQKQHLTSSPMTDNSIFCGL